MSGKIHVILLAAGNSVRFGGNKLLYEIEGKPLYRFLPDTLEQVSACDGVRCIVSQYEEILEQMAERGYCCVKNDKPEEGISRSIRLGIEYLENAKLLQEEDAILFGVCDQPYMQAETLEGFLSAYRASEKGLGCVCKQGTPGNPAVFSAAYWKELKELTNDQGGKKIIRRYPEDVCWWEAPSALELEDIDRQESLEAILFERKRQREEKKRLRFRLPALPKNGREEEENLSQEYYRLCETGILNLIEQLPQTKDITLTKCQHVTVSIVGAGGKTTFAYALAEELKRKGIPVLVTTTTHMRETKERCFLWREDIPGAVQLEELKRCMRETGVWTAGKKAKDGKIQSLPEEALTELQNEAGVLILEADGAKERLIKMPAGHEPVIAAKTDLVIGVTSFLALGKPVGTAHRSELVEAFLAKSKEELLTEEDVLRIMTSVKGLKKDVFCSFVPVLNRCPEGWQPKLGRQFAEQGIILCEEME